MIYGIGTDTVLIERIRAAQARTGGRLAERVLGPQELEKFHARSARNAVRGIAFLATRFAAKEAVSKAIGLGMRWPMSWRAVQTLNDASGKPVVSVSGELAAWLAERHLRLHVSVSDERDVAAAFAVAEIVTDAAGSTAVQAVDTNAAQQVEADPPVSGAP